MNSLFLCAPFITPKTTRLATKGVGGRNASFDPLPMARRLWLESCSAALAPMRPPRQPSRLLTLAIKSLPPLDAEIVHALLEGGGLSP